MNAKAKKCAELLNRCFPHGGRWSEQDIKDILSRDGGYLFENTGGFLIAQSVLDEAEIWAFAVQPEKRRQGHASDLLQIAKAHFRANGINKLFLDVAANNAAAIGLYEAHGFSESGRRRAYYSDESGKRVDAILMSRTL